MGKGVAIDRCGCGSFAVGSMSYHRRGGGFAAVVRCDHCGCTGPTEKHQDDAEAHVLAVHAWNKTRRAERRGVA